MKVFVTLFLLMISMAYIAISLNPQARSICRPCFAQDADNSDIGYGESEETDFC